MNLASLSPQRAAASGFRRGASAGERVGEQAEALRATCIIALAICFAGSIPLVGEARTHQGVIPDTEEVVTVRPESPVVNLAWEADVKVSGGVFKLFAGQEPFGMNLLAEVEAQSGQRSYRCQQPSPATGDSGNRSLRYELRFETSEGVEFFLASIIVVERNLASAAIVDVSSQHELGILGLPINPEEIATRLSWWQRRTLPRHGSRCPPPRPP